MTSSVNLPPICQKLTAKNEQIWIKIGSISELMGDNERALKAYESALRHNPDSINALKQIGSICRSHEEYHKAIEYFQKVVNLNQNNGEVWGALGHCYLMIDDLQKAHFAYQNALQSLNNPKVKIANKGT